MKFKFLRLLFNPTPAEGGNPPVPASGANLMDTATMDEVFSRLNLPAELKGEAPQAKPAKPAKPAAEAKPEGETAEEVEQEQTESTEEQPGETTEEAKPEGEEATEETTEAVAPEFTAEQQAFIDEQKAALDTELATFKQQAEAATARVVELEQALQTTPKEVAAIHPLLLIDDAAKLQSREREIASFQKWALANWDGTDEIPAQGDKPAVPAYTAEQVRERYAQLSEERESMIPLARQHIEYRRQWDVVAKQEYPKLMDPKTPEAKIVESILRQAPGLKAIFPNIKVMIGDALVGEEIRLKKAQARKTGKKTTAAAPKVPLTAKPGGRSTLAPKPKADGDISAAKFRELGGTRDALVTMIGRSSLVN